jgi:hypothetical protein
MSIIDILIYTIDFIFQNTILAILPTSAAGLSLDQLQTNLTALQSTVIASLSGYGFVAPMSFILALAVIVVAAEFSLFTFHIAMFIVKLIRGGG